MGILRKLLRARSGLVLAGLLATSGLGAQPSREYDLKAVFLFNFATFVEWPAAAFPGLGAPFVIGLLGDDPFGSVIDDVVAGEKVRNHPIVVRRLQRADEAAECHLVFIGNSESRRLGGILQACRGRPVLTVADIPDFAALGGMIGFTTEMSRVRLQLNPAAAQANGLTISSKLLQLGRVVDIADHGLDR